MKTLVEKTSGVSVYLFNDTDTVVLKEDCIEVGEPAHLIISDLTSLTAELVDVSSVPADWKGRAYILRDGVWAYNMANFSGSELEWLTAQVQAHLDAEAKTHNYDGILSACSYATSTNPRFSAEGKACIAWRDAVWAECYAILGQVQAGQRQPPTISELLTMLPAMTWPEV